MQVSYTGLIKQYNSTLDVILHLTQINAFAISTIILIVKQRFHESAYAQQIPF